MNDYQHNSPSKKVTVVSYCRVSSHDQVGTLDNPKGSLDTQRGQAEAYAKKMSWHYLNDYREEGISGEKFEERPAIQQLLEDARAGKFRAVIVANGDRIARLEHIYHNIIYILEYECRIPVIDLSNPLPVDPANFNPKADESRLIHHSLKAMFASIDQRQRIRRLVEGRKTQVSKGKFIHGKVPYGYKIEYRTVEKDGKVTGVERVPVPDPERYPYLRMMFEWYVKENMSDLGIAERLTRMGVPTTNGGIWTGGVISYILTNPFYAGLVSFSRHKQIENNGHKSLIRNKDEKSIVYGEHNYEHPWTMEERAAILQKRKASQNGPTRTSPGRNPLGGLVKCDNCGGMMSYVRPTSSHTSVYYMCARHRRNKEICRYHSIPVRMVLKGVASYFDKMAEELAKNPESFYGNIEKDNLEIKLQTLTRQITEAQRKLEQVEKRSDRLVDALADGTLSKEQYQSAIARYDQEKEQLQLSLEEYTAQVEEARNRASTSERKRDLMKEWQNWSEVIKNVDPREWTEKDFNTIKLMFQHLMKSVRVDSVCLERRRKEDSKWRIKIWVEMAV